VGPVPTGPGRFPHACKKRDDVTKTKKIWIWVGTSAAVLLFVLALISIQVLQSPWFANYIRVKIVATAEESTGGRVELGSFRFDWRHLQATIGGFVLHGTEPPGSAPLFQAQSIVLRLKLLAGLKKAVDLDYLAVDQPRANIIVFPDGNTNIPAPKIPSDPNKSTLQTVVDLAIHKFEISNGSLSFAGQNTGISGHGQDLRAQLSYEITKRDYQGNIHIGQVEVLSGDGQPLNGTLDLPVTIGRDSIELNGARLQTPESQIVANVSVSHMASPITSGHLISHISLAELQRTFKTAITPCKQGVPCFADSNIEARLENNSLSITKATVDVGNTKLEATGNAASLQFTGKIATDQIARLFRLSMTPVGDVDLSGAAQLKDLNNIQVEDLRLSILGGQFEGRASLAQQARFDVSGTLKSFGLARIETRFFPGRPGYQGTVAGNIHAAGDLHARGSSSVQAQARLTITPGHQGVPLSGLIDAAYDGAGDSINLNRSYLVLPHSRLDLSGTLSSRINFELSSTNTNDLYPALAMSTKNPPAEMPVTLNGGKLELKASVQGLLKTPSIRGEVTADRFSVEKRPFDRLLAHFSASPSELSVEGGSLTRQTLVASFAGLIGLRQWSPENSLPLRVSLDMRNAEVPDLLAFAGQPEVPITGMLNASAMVQGTLGNPVGSAQLSAVNGTAYDEPFNRVDAQVTLSDQLIRLTSLNVTAPSGQLQALGTYTHPRETLANGRIQAHISSNQLMLEQVKNIQKRHSGLAGVLQINADTSADVRSVAGETEVALTSIQGDVRAQNIHDASRRYGNLTANATTSNSKVNFKADSDLLGSSIRVTGQSTLTKDYPTTADASIQNLSIEQALAFAGENYPAQGVLALNGHLSGTWRSPSADAQLNITKAVFDGEPFDTVQGNVRYTDTVVDVPNLRLASAAGSVALNGSFDHAAGQFENGQFRFHVASDDLRLRQVHHIQEREPGLTGVLKVVADAAGELKTTNGNSEVLLSRVDASGGATGLVYNGRTYGDATFSANTKGENVAFAVDSNFANAAIHGKGEAKLQSGYPLTAQVTVANLRYSNIRGLFEADSTIRPDFDALLEADASVSGPASKPDQLKGRLQVSRLELTSSPRGITGAAPVLSLKNEGPIVATFDRSAFKIENGHLTGRSTDIRVDGTAGISGTNPLNLTIKANTDLGLLQDIDRDIYSSGAVTIDSVIRGSYSSPLLNGTVQLKNASLNIASLPSGLSNANGVIALSGSSATIQNLTAESGGGKLNISGFATQSGATVRYSLRATASRVRTRYQDVSVVSDVDLSLAGTTERGLFSGAVTVRRFGYNPQSDFGAILAGSTTPPPAASGAPGFLDATRLDIRITTAPDVQFQTSLARQLQASADLNLVGSLRNPGITGRIVLAGGDLVFFRNQYTVNDGSITFYNPLRIEPRLNVNLETTVKNINVALGVTGPMENLKLSYHSDPPLSFDEIVGLLATGRVSTTDPTILAHQPTPVQQSLGQMGESAVLSQAVASPLAGRLQRVFGVNQLSIDPTFASGSALPQARVSLQQQVTSTITFTYSQDLTQSNSQLIRVEWAVSPRFSAVATRDENGIFGVDFFYKRQFR